MVLEQRRSEAGQDGLAAVALALGGIYAGLAPAHLWFVEGPGRLAMAAWALASAVAGFALAWRWHRRPQAPRRFHVRLSLLFAIALANSALHMAVEPSPQQTTNFALIAVLTGLFCVSHAWLAALLGVNLVCWAALAWAAPAAPGWIHFAFFFVMANAAAATFHGFRVRGLHRLERSNLELERAHAELRESEAKLRRAQGIAHLGSYEFDGTGTGTMTWSEETFRIVGLDPAGGPPSLDEYVRRFVHPDDVGPFESAVERARQGEQPDGLVHRVVRPDGSVRYVEVRGSVLEGAGGPSRWVGTLLDVTEREQIEEALHQRQAELSHAARLGTLGEMSAALAHELHQPLAAIVNYARGCARRLEAGGKVDAPAIQEALDEICNQAERSSGIVRTLFGFARKAAPKREWIELDQVAQEVLRLVDFDARRHEIGVRWEPNERVTWLQADPVQVAQVLLNLVRNGLDAIRDGESPVRELTISARPAEGEMLEIRVTDSGCGLTAESEDAIFEPFTTSKATGLGLGLSISRRIVESHGGRIWTSANPDAGTTFHFTLPGRLGEAQGGE